MQSYYDLLTFDHKMSFCVNLYRGMHFIQPKAFIEKSSATYGPKIMLSVIHDTDSFKKPAMVIISLVMVIVMNKWVKSE